ncbi:RNA-binding transcriptional accessory protein, partial [Bacillus licheniformis]
YRPKRRTRATIAKEKGLEPLSLAMNLESPDDESFLTFADTFISEEKEVHTREEALQGAMDIIAESISDDADVRGEIKHLIRQYGFIQTEAADAEQKSVYEMYYEFKEALKSVANHRVLALNRGEKEKFLKVSIFIDKVAPVEKLVSEFVVKKNSVPGGYKAMAIEDGYKRLLFPSLERELRNDLT